MNRTRRFILFSCISLLVLASSSYSESPNELYQRGKSSFDTSDYLSAVKYLFAYSQMSGNSGEVTGALIYAEKEITRAIQITKQLDNYGEITKITTRGKADGNDITVPFRMPEIRRQQRPNLKDVGSLPPPSNPTYPSNNLGGNARCDIYARIAVAQNDANLQNRCGFTGGRWVSDYRYHFDWCRSQSVADTKSETAERQRMLDQCASR